MVFLKNGDSKGTQGKSRCLSLRKNKLVIEAIGKAGDNMVYFMPNKDVLRITTGQSVEGYRLEDPWKAFFEISTGIFTRDT